MHLNACRLGRPWLLLRPGRTTNPPTVELLGKDNALALPESRAVARLTGGGTTKGGTFDYTRHDAHSSGIPFTQCGEAEQAEIRRQHILATATTKADFALVAR